MNQAVMQNADRSTMGWLLVVGYALPIGVVLAGVLVFVLAPSSSRFEGAAACIGAGLSILLLNLLYGAGVRGDADRDDEERAREFFDDHGYWPGKKPRASDPGRSPGL
jgi:hypothetical protein